MGRVVTKPTTTSALLRLPTTKKLINGGRAIPWDQIIAGPVKAQLSFDSRENEVRAMSQILAEDDALAGDTAGDVE